VPQKEPAMSWMNDLNRWYDRLPPGSRFQVVLWPLVLISALNMALTVAWHFPFGLLTVVGIVFIAVVRVPDSIRRRRDPTPAAAGETIQIEADWINDLNRRYEAIPENWRFFVPLLILLAAGAVNMLLTIHLHFPFGLLFLLVLLALVAIRGPYRAGWIKPMQRSGAEQPEAPP